MNVLLLILTIVAGFCIAFVLAYYDAKREIKTQYNWIKDEKIKAILIDEVKKDLERMYRIFK